MQIHLPPMAVVSILHRLTGIGLFLSLPFVVALLDISLRDEAGFALARELLDSTWIKLLAALALGLYGFHLVAGIRFLSIDLGYGVLRPAHRITAWVVLLLGVLILIAAVGWGVAA